MDQRRSYTVLSHTAFSWEGASFQLLARMVVGYVAGIEPDALLVQEKDKLLLLLIEKLWVGIEPTLKPFRAKREGFFSPHTPSVPLAT